MYIYNSRFKVQKCASQSFNRAFTVHKCASNLALYRFFLTLLWKDDNEGRLCRFKMKRLDGREEKVPFYPLSFFLLCRSLVGEFFRLRQQHRRDRERRRDDDGGGDDHEYSSFFPPPPFPISSPFLSYSSSRTFSEIVFRLCSVFVFLSIFVVGSNNQRRQTFRVKFVVTEIVKLFVTFFLCVCARKKVFLLYVCDETRRRKFIFCFSIFFPAFTHYSNASRGAEQGFFFSFFLSFSSQLETEVFIAFLGLVVLGGKRTGVFTLIQAASSPSFAWQRRFKNANAFAPPAKQRLNKPPPTEKRIKLL